MLGISVAPRHSTIGDRGGQHGDTGQPVLPRDLSMAVGSAGGLPRRVRLQDDGARTGSVLRTIPSEPVGVDKAVLATMHRARRIQHPRLGGRLRREPSSRPRTGRQVPRMKVLFPLSMT
jgi:hypothetical protein